MDATETAASVMLCCAHAVETVRNSVSFSKQSTDLGSMTLSSCGAKDTDVPRTLCTLVPMAGVVSQKQSRPPVTNQKLFGNRHWGKLFCVGSKFGLVYPREHERLNYHANRWYLKGFEVTTFSKDADCCYHSHISCAMVTPSRYPRRPIENCAHTSSCLFHL